MLGHLHEGRREGVQMIRNDDERRQFYLDGAPVSHPSEGLLLDWTARLRSEGRDSGTDGIARFIIQDFALRHFLGVPQSPITTGWLAECLGEILNYADPLKTFRLLPRPKKRPPDPQRGWDIACWVAVSEKRGYSHAGAIEAAADLFCMDDSNVRKLCKTLPEWMNPAEDVWEEYFRLCNRPLPAWKAKAGKK